MSFEYFHNWILETFCPCGIVYSSKASRSILSKYNITPSEFLRPFGEFREKEFKIIFDAETTINLKYFKLDFYDAVDYKKNDPTKIKNFLYKSLENKDIIPNWNLFMVHLTKNQIEQILLQIQQNSFPWFLEYERTFLELIRFDETEMLQQPLINIEIYSMKDEIESIDKIKEEQTPLLIKENIYEKEMPIIVILLNDLDDPLPQDKVEFQIGKFKKKYLGQKVIGFNFGGSKENNNIKENDLWEKYMHKSDFYNDKYQMREQKGKKIDMEQMEPKFKFFYDQLANNIFPRIVYWINNEKKKKYKEERNFLFFKKKNIEKVQCFDIYKLSYKEHSLYLISILCFFLQNYNEAKIHLKKLRSEIKGKSKRHENNIEQLYLICKYLVVKDIDKVKILNPFNNYYKERDLYGMLRAIIIENKIQEKGDQFGKHLQRVNNIIKSFSKNQIITALLMERNSFLYLINFVIPPYRKFILWIALSAASYRSNEKLSLNYTQNSYGFLYKLLDNTTQSYLRMKIFYYNEMGDICSKLNYVEGSILFYKKTFEFNKYIPNERERDKLIYQRYCQFKQLISIDENTNTIYTNDFSIPEIDNDSAIVIEEQDLQIENSFTKEQKCKVFSNYISFNRYTYKKTKVKFVSLDESDIQILKNLTQNIITRRGTLVMRKTKKEYTCTIGEQIYLRFKIKNPLNNILTISGLTLILDTEDNINNVDSVSNNNNNNTSSLYSEKKDLVLNPKEEIEVYLKCSMQTIGFFEIKGIELKLLNNLTIRNVFITENNNFNMYKYNRRKMTDKINHLRDGFIIKVIDKDIDVIFPKGKNVQIYQYVLYYFPIIIKNTTSYNVKRVSIFFHEYDYQTNKEIENENFLCNFLFNELEFAKEQKFYIPILPNYNGEFYALVVIKFEEEFKKKSDFEIKRYIIKFTVLPTLNFKFQLKANCFNPIIQTNSNFLIITTEVMGKEISNLNFLDNITYNTKSYQIISDAQWDKFTIEGRENYYRKYKIKVNLIKCKDNLNDQCDLNLIESSNDNKLDNEVKSKLNKRIIEQNEICFHFECNINNLKVNGLYFHFPTFILPDYNKDYIISFILTNISFTFTYFPLMKDNCVILKGHFDNKKDFQTITEWIQLKIETKKNKIINRDNEGSKENINKEAKKESDNEIQLDVSKEDNIDKKEEHDEDVYYIDQLKWLCSKNVMFDLNKLNDFTLSFITSIKGIININSIHFIAKFKHIGKEFKVVYPLSVIVK